MFLTDNDVEKSWTSVYEAFEFYRHIESLYDAAGDEPHNLSKQE